MTSDPSAARPARPTVALAPPLPPSTARAAALRLRRFAVPPLASSARPTTGPQPGCRLFLPSTCTAMHWMAPGANMVPLPPLRRPPRPQSTRWTSPRAPPPLRPLSGPLPPALPWSAMTMQWMAPPFAMQWMALATIARLHTRRRRPAPTTTRLLPSSRPTTGPMALPSTRPSVTKLPPPRPRPPAPPPPPTRRRAAPPPPSSSRGTALPAMARPRPRRARRGAQPDRPPTTSSTPVLRARCPRHKRRLLPLREGVGRRPRGRPRLPLPPGHCTPHRPPGLVVPGPRPPTTRHRRRRRRHRRPNRQHTAPSPPLLDGMRISR